MCGTGTVTNNRIVQPDPQVSIGAPEIPHPVVFRQIINGHQIAANPDRRRLGVRPIAVGEQVVNMVVPGIDRRIENSGQGHGRGVEESTKCCCCAKQRFCVSD